MPRGVREWRTCATRFGPKFCLRRRSTSAACLRLVPADRLPAELPAQQDPGSGGRQPQTQRPCQALQLALPALPALRDLAAVGVPRSAVPPNGSAAPRSCSRRCCWQPARSAISRPTREPYLATVAASVAAVGGADLPGAVAARPASGVRRAALLRARHVLSPSSRPCGPAPRCWAARSRPGSPAASPSSSIRPMAASA